MPLIAPIPLVDPVIYSSSYQVPENLDYIKYVENKDVPASFKERMRYVKNEMLEQMVAANPQLCRPDYETVETGCLSPIRGSEYYLVYDKGQVLGFVFIGYGVEINGNSLGFKDAWAYRYIVYKNGHVVQNGFF